LHNRQEAVIEALGLLGSAYRGDWSYFDGRSLRAQLDELAGVLTADKPFDVEAWAHVSGICPVGRGWHEHCPDRRTGGSNPGGNCPHHEAFLDAWRAAHPAPVAGRDDNGTASSEAPHG
jgi:hypothetical protein